MRYLLSGVAAVAALLVWLGVGVAQQPPGQEATYQAAAYAPVSGGNLAAARQAALAAALRDAVDMAALDLMGSAEGAERLRAWPHQPGSYVLSYRVVFETAVPWPGEEAALPQGESAPAAPGATALQLAAPPPPAASEVGPAAPGEEGEDEPVYCVRVEAVVSLPALKRDLRAQGLLGTQQMLPAVVAKVEEVPTGLEAGSAEAMLVEALRQAGFKARTEPEWFNEDRGELVVAARLGLTCGGGGCRGKAALVGRDTAALRASAGGSGTGRSPQEALGEALRTAVASLARQLVALQERVAVVLSLRGVDSYGELVQIKAALEEMGLAGRERSLSAREIVLQVADSGGGEALAERLRAKAFDGFRLETAAASADTLAMDAVHPDQQPSLAQ